MRATLVINSEIVECYIPYELKEDIKEIPGRRWNPEKKCWTVPRHALSEAMDLLSTFCDVTLESDANWIREALICVPPEHLDRIYKALAFAFHPDQGGDALIMRMINETYQYLKRGE